MGQIQLLGGGRNTFIRGKFRGRAYNPPDFIHQGYLPVMPTSGHASEDVSYPLSFFPAKGRQMQTAYNKEYDFIKIYDV